MGRLALPDELVGLLDRLALGPGAAVALDAAEVAAWPPALAAAMVGQGWMARAAPAASVICPGCEEACVRPVHRRPRDDGAGALAFVACELRADMGRVPIAPALLERWQVTRQTVGDALARVLGRPAAQPLGEVVRLGWVDSDAGRAPVLLAEGGGGWRLVVAGQRLELPQVLTWDGSTIGLNMAALRRHALSGHGAEVGERPADRAGRLQRRKTELVQAGERRFLKVIAAEEGLSETRVKQLLAWEPKREAAGPFDGLGVQPAQGSPASRPKKGKA